MRVRLPWWLSLLLAPFWLAAFMVWFVVALMLGLAALSVEAVRWLYAYTQRSARRR